MSFGSAEWQCELRLSRHVFDTGLEATVVWFASRTLGPLEHAAAEAMAAALHNTRTGIMNLM